MTLIIEYNLPVRKCKWRHLMDTGVEHDDVASGGARFIWIGNMNSGRAGDVDTPTHSHTQTHTHAHTHTHSALGRFNFFFSVVPILYHCCRPRDPAVNCWSAILSFFGCCCCCLLSSPVIKQPVSWSVTTHTATSTITFNESDVTERRKGVVWVDAHVALSSEFGFTKSAVARSIFNEIQWNLQRYVLK